MPMPSCGLDQLDHHADDFGGRVELAALLARTVGEVFDEVFVGGPEQIGELEVVVGQGDVVEVLDERHQRVVVHRPLADLAIEVDPLEHVLQRVGIGVFDGGQGLVQPSRPTSSGVQVLAARSSWASSGRRAARRSRTCRDCRVASRSGWVIESLASYSAAQLGPVGGELVAQPLEEQHAEDVFLVLRGIHVAPQDVARLEQQASRAWESELGHRVPCRYNETISIESADLIMRLLHSGMVSTKTKPGQSTFCFAKKAFDPCLAARLHRMPQRPHIHIPVMPRTVIHARLEVVVSQFVDLLRQRCCHFAARYFGTVVVVSRWECEHRRQREHGFDIALHSGADEQCVGFVAVGDDGEHGVVEENPHGVAPGCVVVVWVLFG